MIHILWGSGSRAQTGGCRRVPEAALRDRSEEASAAVTENRDPVRDTSAGLPRSRGVAAAGSSIETASAPRMELLKCATPGDDWAAVASWRAALVRQRPRH